MTNNVDLNKGKVIDPNGLVKAELQEKTSKLVVAERFYGLYKSIIKPTDNEKHLLGKYRKEFEELNDNVARLTLKIIGKSLK